MVGRKLRAFNHQFESTNSWKIPKNVQVDSSGGHGIWETYFNLSLTGWEATGFRKAVHHWLVRKWATKSWNSIGVAVTIVTIRITDHFSVQSIFSLHKCIAALRLGDCLKMLKTSSGWEIIPLSTHVKWIDFYRKWTGCPTIAAHKSDGLHSGH